MLSSLLVLSLSARYVEPTSVIREMAKCETPIEIVYSGDKTKPAADRFADSIQNRKDFNKKKAVVVHSMQDYEAATHLAADAETVVAIVAKEEASQLPPKLGGLFPSHPSFDGESANLITLMPRAKAGQITFDALIEAPIADDLPSAIDLFNGFSTQNWRDLKFNDQVRINRVQTSGTNVLNWTPNWGRLVGHVVNTITYSEAVPENSDNADQVFFWNRSANGTQMPSAFKSLTDGFNLNPLTFAALRKPLSNGHFLALYIAPSDKVLSHLAAKFPTIRSISDSGFIGQANDLRANKRTLLVVNQTGIDRDISDAVSGYVESDLRNRARLSLLQRGSAPEVIGQDLASQDVANRLKSQYGVRWVASLDVSNAIGSVDYIYQDQCLSSEPAAYAPSAPSEPTRNPLFGHRLTDDEWAKAQAQYKKDLGDYNEKKAKYEYEDRVQWRKSIVKKSRGEVHVTLKLIDLEDNSRVIWLGERSGKAEDSTVVRSEIDTVSGHMRKPRAWDCPRPENTAPQTVKNAGSRAVVLLVRDFVGENLLPDEGVSLPVEATEIKAIAVEPPIITINAGQDQGVKIGDHVVVEIFRDIVDPNTKALIERVPIDKVTLEVTRVGKTSDCKASTPKDSELLAKIKVGDVVQIVKG